MPITRPTFSESWYRVAELRPRLRSTVRVFRQAYRGTMWHVLQDSSSNQHFRLSNGGYRLVGLLDGQRTVAEAWRIANEQVGDEAPTQGETIQLLGQLYASNLLHADIPGDAEGLFNRYRKRVRREVQGYVMNLLFARLPLLDPDHFLSRWVGVFGKIFTRWGLLAWGVFLVTGLYFLAGRWGELSAQAESVLNPNNLFFLYLSIIGVKILHEMGHAFSCKRFGLAEGSGGEVHVLGIMLLVFTPMPYVDVSSAWALRDKWRRVVIGAAGMMVELAVASVAAVVWAGTAPGTVHTVAYNILFTAGISTILFNANPLLRYDGYYILCDLLEIPNLTQKARDYLYYLVKRYVWGVQQAKTTTVGRREKTWLLIYALSSNAYRIVICAGILLFIADKLFLLGAILAVAAVVTWVGAPLGRFIHYLLHNPELTRVRPRAIGTTAAFAVFLFVGVGVIPFPDRCRVVGVVEPARMATIHAGANGFVRQVLATNAPVKAGRTILLEATSPDLRAQQWQLTAERRGLEARYRLAQTQEPAAAQALAEQLAAMDDQIRRVEQQIDALSVTSPLDGVWVAPQGERLGGAYLRRGDPIGLVASLDTMIIRSTAGQNVVAQIIAEARPRVDIRVQGRPEMERGGVIQKIFPAGQNQLPSAALGYAAGGAMETLPDDRHGMKTAEQFFEIVVTPDDGQPSLYAGQRVVVRFSSGPKPLALQGWRALQQLVQRRFHI